MTWLWMYMNWAQDVEEKHELLTDYSIFLGSFSNAEAAQKMNDTRKPKFDLTDEEFEQSMQRVIEEGKMIEAQKEQTKSPHRRKRRKVIS